MLSPTGAGSSTYEPTYPPRIIAATAEAIAFYVEFRARDDGAFGHSYVTIGTIDTIGQLRETVVVGFMARALKMTIGASLEYRSQYQLGSQVRISCDDPMLAFGLPSTGPLIFA